MSLSGGLGPLDVARTGRVEAFDEGRGLGAVIEVTESGTGESFPFHCTAVADGSRQIDVGARVRFRLRAGNGGRFEADELLPACD